MVGFSWNIRGFRKALKHSLMKSWVDEYGLHFDCVLETRVKEDTSSQIMKEVFQNWSSFTNYSFNRKGQIWVVWKDTLQADLVSISEQMITCATKLAGYVHAFLCTFVYALNEATERKELWKEIKALHENQLYTDMKWILMDDFNEILDGCEHLGYNIDPSLRSGTKYFQRLANYCEFSDLYSHGPLLTWCNKRGNGLICKRLDRSKVRDGWEQSFQGSYCVFEGGGCSDHLRCRISLGAELPRPKKPFKFVNVLTTLPYFFPRVEEYWKETGELYISTSAMHKFIKKLKEMKQVIKQLHRDKIGDLTIRAKVALLILEKKQELTLLNPWEANFEEEALAEKECAYWD